MALRADTRNRSTIRATDTLEQAADRIATADRNVKVSRNRLKDAVRRKDGRDIGNASAELDLDLRISRDTTAAYKAMLKAAAAAEKAAAKAAAGR